MRYEVDQRSFIQYYAQGFRSPRIICLGPF